MQSLNDILEKIADRDDVNKGPRLLLTDLATDKSIINNLPANAFAFICTASNVDLPVNAEFNILFSYSNPADYLEVKSSIKRILNIKNEELPYLPQRYSALCVIQFDKNEALRGFIKNVKKEDDKYIKGTHDFLYLTTRPMMDKILEFLNEE